MQPDNRERLVGLTRNSLVCAALIAWGIAALASAAEPDSAKVGAKSDQDTGPSKPHWSSPTPNYVV